jgi:thiol-disulfide isomerase/thioredoxin
MKFLFLVILILGNLASIGQSNSVDSEVDKRQVEFNNDTAYITAHPDSLKSVILLNFHYSSLPYDFSLFCFQRFNTSYSNTKEYTELANKISLGELNSIGIKINNFSFETNNNTIASIDSIINKNKLTLLDFWASWCGPCRQNISHIKVLSEEYKTKGFGILSISIENNKDAWKKAIEVESMYNFYHGIDDSLKSIQTQLGIFAIPTYILLNNKMEIVGKFNSRWKGQQDLDKFLSNYFKQE